MGLFSTAANKQSTAFSKGMRAYRDGDYRRCRKLWKKLADGGEARAQAGLAHLYANGLGIDKDLQQAFEWTLKAAEQGLAQSQNNLGWYYEHGTGVQRDADAALHWYRQAAEQQDSIAQTNLGYMHARTAESQDAPPEAAETALSWFQRAADQGNHQAQQALADAYEFGRLGLERDQSKADFWHQQAQRR